MICDAFHVEKASGVDTAVHPSDRFLVAKFLAPRRWDLIVFEYPSEPEILCVKRLIGLPGETVLTRDGSVWIDGMKQTSPDSMQGIEYLNGVPNWYGPEPSGTEKRPAVLGENEYFVLGDFSAQAMDSRMWTDGAPGHNSFAVPRSYIKGVVTHTIWPFDRWRIHC